MPEIIIELADEKNRQRLFGPTNEKLRGRWSNMNSNGGRSMHPSMQRMPPMIPGIYLSVDADKRILKRYDPLNTTDEGKEIWAKVEAISAADELHFTKSKPMEEVVIEAAPDNQIKTWLYWFRRLVDNKEALIHAGGEALPKLDDFGKLPGKVHDDLFGIVAGSKRFKDLGEPEEEEKPRRQGAGAGREAGAGSTK